jgi:hypothetical protein
LTAVRTGATGLDGSLLGTATEHGRICALAMAGQRDLLRCAHEHPELFPPRPFDPAVFSGVALATAFGAPWCDAASLRVANRAAAYVFALDWRIDTLAGGPADLDGLLDRCLAVAGGAAPGADDPLGRLLVEIRDDVLAAAPAPARAAWREELRRMVTAMLREHGWKTAAATGTAPLPDLGDYLDNADNFGSSFVNVSHWVHLGDPGTLDRLAGLTRAGRQVQRLLRLVNDLGTYQRDVEWGDLNALLLGVDHDQVRAHVDALLARCGTLVDALRADCPTEAEYLTRQIGFSSGFYRVGDFWGAR